MNILEAIIQGIIQGITEFLPISSDGHLSLAQHMMGIQLDNNLMFTVMLHLGTLIAVFAVFYKLIWSLIKELFVMIADIFRGRFRWREMSHERRMVVMLILGLLPLFLFFLPVPGTDLKIKDYFTFWSTDSDIMIEAFCFLLTGVILLLGHRASILAERRGIPTRENLNTVDALIIGLFQGLAALPGVSRSGSTISVGMMRGINRQVALDYSFVLGVPAILAANVLEVNEALDTGAAFDMLPILVGIVVAAVVGFFAIKLLKLLVTKNRLNIFAYYCLILGGIVLIVSIVERIKGINIFSGNPL